MSDLISLDVTVDVAETLAPKPDEREFSQGVWSHADLRVVGRALRGHPPRDEDERESRRILLNGIVWELTGEQEQPP